MSILEFYPAAALIAVIGGFWGYASLQSRRLKRAVAEAAAKLNGTYTPGGHLSGGTLFVKSGGRDVVFEFLLGHSSRSESTSVGTTLAKPVPVEIELKGGDAVARAPGLAPYSRRFAPVRITVTRNLLNVRVAGVVRRSQKLVDLASIVSALAAEMESP